jgi:hypothetical protein
MYNELVFKLQKFIRLLIDGLDADHLGQLMVDSDLRQLELEMFLRRKIHFEGGELEAYNKHIDELQKLQDKKVVIGSNEDNYLP